MQSRPEARFSNPPKLMFDGKVYLGFFQDWILIVGFLLTVNEKYINHVQKNYFSKFITVFIKLKKECRKIEVNLVICTCMFFNQEFM